MTIFIPMRRYLSIPASFLSMVLIVAVAHAAEPIVVVGQTLGLTANGTEKQRAERVQQGALAYFNRVNNQSGGGLKFTLKTLDDGGKSAKVKENMAALGADQSVIALFGMAGGGACREAMSIANQNGLPLVGCMAGSPQLRKPNDWVFNIRPGHDAEYKAMASQLKSFAVKVAFFVHDDNETGAMHLTDAKAAMAAEGITLAGSFAVSSSSDSKLAVAALKKSASAAVFNQGPNPFFADVIKQSRDQGLSGLHYMSVSSGADSLVAALQDSSRGLMFTQVVPYPFTDNSSLQLVRDYRQDLRALYPAASPSYDSFEAYLSAKLLVLGMQKSGKKPTRESLALALGNLGDVNLGGMRLKMGKKGAAASALVDVVMASPGSNIPFLK